VSLTAVVDITAATGAMTLGAVDRVLASFGFVDIFVMTANTANSAPGACKYVCTLGCSDFDFFSHFEV
jgi:hypothetical protein